MGYLEIVGNFTCLETEAGKVRNLLNA